MTVEQIAIRQEIRQMLNEAGINRNTLKDMVKEVLEENIENAVKQAINETDVNSKISRSVNDCITNKTQYLVKECIRERVRNVFDGMTVSVEITDKGGSSIITR